VLLYSRVYNVVKVFKSPGWERKFNDYVTIFQEHKIAIHADLDLQISAGVSSANESIARVEAKVNLIVFSLLRSSSEKDLITYMGNKRPAAYLQNDSELQALIRFSEQKTIERKKDKDPRVPDRDEKGREGEDGFELKLMLDIKREMVSSVEAMLEENMKVFSVKFDLQQKQIVADISVVVRREGDRLESALLSGPHDRILDQVGISQ
jgi:hypothetical protein